MVAIMRYSMGLKFTGIICEDESTARKYLIEEKKVPDYVLDDCYKIIPVNFIEKKEKTS